MTHGRAAEAERVVAGIEARIAWRGQPIASEALPRVRLRPRTHTPLREVAAHAAASPSPAHAGRLEPDGGAGVFLQRDLLHLRAGADRFLRHRAASTSAGTSCRSRPGNFLGPLMLGRLFDTIGRRTMIAFTYIMSGVLLAITGYLFAQGMLTRRAADARLDGDFLLRLGGGELGLSHGERNLPAGDPRAGDRHLLCDRHRHRRRCRAVAVRRADRHRLARAACSAAICSAPR